MRIGNPQNMEGKDLLVGISAINADSSFVASDIKTIKAGSNVSLSASGAVLTVNATTSANESATINCFVDITTSSVEDDLVVLSLVDKSVVAIIDHDGRQWPCVGEDEVVVVSDGVVQVDLSYIFNKLNITSIPTGATWRLVIVGGVPQPGPPDQTEQPEPGGVSLPITRQRFARPYFDQAMHLVIQAAKELDFSDAVTIIDTEHNAADRAKVISYTGFVLTVCPVDGFGGAFSGQPVFVDLSALTEGTFLRYKWTAADGDSDWYVTFFPSNGEAYVAPPAATSSSEAVAVTTGILMVNITGTTGGQWSIDGGTTWNDSGNQLSLEADDYTISFKTVDGYITPANQTATVTIGEATTLYGTYTEAIAPDATALTVTIYGAAGQWSIDSGTNWNNSGVTLTPAAGDYTITFSAVEGYTAPANKSVTVSLGIAVNETASYTSAITPGTAMLYLLDDAGDTLVANDVNTECSGMATTKISNVVLVNGAIVAAMPNDIRTLDFGNNWADVTGFARVDSNDDFTAAGLAVNTDGKLYVFQIKTGNVVLQQLGEATDWVSVDCVFYATNSSGSLYRWSGSTPETLTMVKIGDNLTGLAYAFIFAYTIVMGNNGTLYCVTGNSSNFTLRQINSGRVYTVASSPLSAPFFTDTIDSVVYLIDEDGKLYALYDNTNYGQQNYTYRFSITQIGAATNWVNVVGDSSRANSTYKAWALNSDGNLYALTNRTVTLIGSGFSGAKMTINYILKSDGTLYKRNGANSPILLGAYSDWIDLWSTNFALRQPSTSGDTPAATIGTLKVDITGATGQWSANGGSTWNDSGDTITLATGSYTVSFADVSGYTTPSSQSVTISNNVLSELDAVYYEIEVPTETEGTLIVNITGATGRWSVDAGANWKESGQSLLLTAGSYTITFEAILGYSKPEDISASITAGEITAKSGAYVAQPTDYGMTWDNGTEPVLEEGNKVIFVTPTGAGSKTGADWANAKEGLYTAGLAASNGDVLYLQEGTYTNHLAPVAATKSIGIYGGFTVADGTWATRDNFAHPSIIDATSNPTVPFIRPESGVAQIVDGIACTNFTGGVMLANGGTATVKNCAIYDCDGTASSHAVDNCLILNCSSSSSSGSCIVTGGATDCTFTNCSSSNINYSSSSIVGGGATDCTFTNCSSSSSSNYSSYIVAGGATNCTFTNCRSSSSSGGSYIVAGGATNCTFTNCRSSSYGCIVVGAATNCIITNCSSRISGSLVYSGAKNCTIIRCTANRLTHYASGHDITNCVIFDSDIDIIDFGAGTNNAASAYIDAYTLELGTDNTLALFTSLGTVTTKGWSEELNNTPLAAFGDFRPQTGSVLIGAGVAVEGVTTDITGATRSDPPTIGAYEYVEETP